MNSAKRLFVRPMLTDRLPSVTFRCQGSRSRPQVAGRWSAGAEAQPRGLFRDPLRGGQCGDLGGERSGIVDMPVLLRGLRRPTAASTSVVPSLTITGTMTELPTSSTATNTNTTSVHSPTGPAPRDHLELG